MNKIKILFTIPNFNTAGSGREMFNIIERLDKSLFDIWIAVAEEGGKLFDEIILKGYPIIVKQFIVSTNDTLLVKIKKARTLGVGFKEHGFDVWQSFNWSSDYTEALVARFSGAKFMYVKKNMNWDRLSWKIKSVLSHAIIVRNTTLIDTYFSHWLYRKKTRLISGGVNVDAFRNVVGKPARVEHNIPEHEVLICCTAQIVRIKDQATLIQAISRIPGTYLLLAGAERDSLYVDELKQLIIKLNIGERVFLLNHVERVNELLASSDIFVLPTSTLGGHEEGCPVAILEAMSAGVPCIASDVAGSRDLVVTKETGLLFEPGNVNQLVDCINAYMRQPHLAENMAQNALKNIYNKHTLDIESGLFATAYKQLLNR